MKPRRPYIIPYSSLSLALFEFGILFIDDIELALTTDDLTVNRTLLDGWFDLHNAGEIRLIVCVISWFSTGYLYL